MPAVGESGPAGQKKIVDASKIAHLCTQGHSWRETTEETGQQRNCPDRGFLKTPFGPTATSIFHDRRMLRRDLIRQLDQPMVVFRT